MPSLRPGPLCATLGLSLAMATVAASAADPMSSSLEASGSVQQRAQLVMGTIARVTVEAPRSRTAIEAAFAVMRGVDEEMSLYRPGSELVRVNAHAGRHPEPIAVDLCRVLVEGRRLSDVTNGAFDVTVLPLLRAWGAYRELAYLGTYSAGAVGFAGLDVDAARCTVGFRREGMGIDLGGIAKGFALDRAREVLVHEGASRAILDLGGNLAFLGAGPDGGWRVAVRDPEAPDRPLGVLVLGAGTTVATSANYAREFAVEGWRTPSHVYDPRTARPVLAARAVTVWGPRATVGDALSTALLVLGPEGGVEVLEREPDVGALFVEGRRILMHGRAPLEWIPAGAVSVRGIEHPESS